MVDCGWNSLVGRALVERSFWLLSAFSSVAVHVVASQVVVEDADRLPGAILERQEDDGTLRVERRSIPLPRRVKTWERRARSWRFSSMNIRPSSPLESWH
jgi:hypothetical protein